MAFRMFSVKCNLTRGLFTRCIEIPRLLSVACKQTIAEQMGLPEPPKQPIQPFFRFLMQNREDMKIKHPELSHGEIIIKLSDLWRNIGTEEREKLSQEYEKEKAAYEIRYKEYMKKISPKQIKTIKDMKRSLSKKKIKRYLHRKRKAEQEQLGKPRAPASAFLLFVMSMDHEESNRKDLLVEAGCKWQSLSEDEQKPYFEKAKKQREQYLLELSAWEDKMIKAGRLDLVRSQQQILHKLFQSQHKQDKEPLSSNDK